MRRLLTLVAACSFVLAALPAFAQSQATTAEISGRVTDAQGGVLPGATVTVKSGDTGYTRSVITNAEGRYAIPLLPPGNYELVAELTGFAPTRRSLVLNVGAMQTINAELQVGGVQETVTVAAGSPLVETSATVRTTTLDAEAIANLPINGRRFQDFISATPTVQVDPSRGQLSFAGQRGINSNISVDGADFNQPFFGGIRGGERSNNAFTVPQESIQEFQVIAAGYSAEFGRSTGGLVNAITKSGSNRLKGSAFYVNRNRDWAQNNAFGQNAAPTQQQFGGSIGGPISKDKLFFFAAYEQQVFKNTRQVLFDRLAGLTPAPTSQEAFTYFKSLEEPFDATNDAITTLGRVDWQLGEADRLSVRYSYSSNKALNANATGNALDPNTISALTNNGTEKDRTNIVVGQYTSAISSSLLFEVRGQYGYEERPREANFEGASVQSVIGNYGTVSFLPNKQFDRRTQLAANLTWLTGTHSLKGGAEYNRVFADQTFGFNQFGRFLFSGTDTAAQLEVLSVGGAVANRFDSNLVTYQRQLGNLRLEFPTQEVAFYLQDNWKVRPNLTLNVGLRWEGAANPTPDANNDFMLNALGSVTFPNRGTTMDPTQIPDQWDQWGPRVGFAWDVANDGRTVVRGYTGIYYARTPALLYAAPMNNFRVPAGDLSQQLPLAVPSGNTNNTVYKQLKLIGVDLNSYALGDLPVITPEQLQQVATALGLNPNPYAGSQPLVMDKDFKNPRATQFGAGIEREFLSGVSAGAEYVYVKTDNLQRNVDYNLPAPVVRPTDLAQRPYFGLTSGVARPVTTLGSVQLRESSASSEYNAGVFTARARKSWGQLSVNYVLSKSMSDDDNERDSGGQGAANAFDFGPEWGPARLDRRHQFNGYVLFFLPYKIDLSASFRAYSGRPVDATLGTDTGVGNGDRINTDRPYSAPGVSFQRNAFRNESIKDVNLRAQWKFDLNGGRRLLLTFDAFNVFNWDNLELSGTTVTNYCAAPIASNCGFGEPTNPNFLSLTDQVPTSTRVGQLLLNNLPGAPRQIQLGVRFQF
ncbi:MAG: TonB-dependent receptor [Vicinamibacteria bacterium]|nr:TonB-dependent receptor [Vicinamibacteria bacterium]